MFLITKRRESIDSVDVLLLKSPWTNIGNAFIDIGAYYILKQCLNNKKIYVIGQNLVNPIIDYYSKEPLRKIMTYNIFKELVLRLNKSKIYTAFKKTLLSKYYKYYGVSKEALPFELSLMYNPKYVVITGVSLSKWFLRLYSAIMRKYVEKGSKLVLLGASLDAYTQEEIEFAKNIIKRIKPYAIIFRDHICYEEFRDLTEHSLNSIDPGFFVSEAFKPVRPHNIREYIVLTFDKEKIPAEVKLKVAGKDIIFIHHSFWVPRDAKQIINTVSKNYGRVFVSDNPYDYLTIYAFASEVYTDRVHACVATLSYGNKCHLYSKSPRSILFKQLGLDPSKKPLIVNQVILYRKKQELIRFLSEILNER